MLVLEEQKSSKSVHCRQCLWCSCCIWPFMFFSCCRSLPCSIWPTQSSYVLLGLFWESLHRLTVGKYPHKQQQPHYHEASINLLQHSVVPALWLGLLSFLPNKCLFWSKLIFCQSKLASCLISSKLQKCLKLVVFPMTTRGHQHLALILCDLSKHFSDKFTGSADSLFQIRVILWARKKDWLTDLHKSYQVRKLATTRISMLLHSPVQWSQLKRGQIRGFKTDQFSFMSTVQVYPL